MSLPNTNIMPVEKLISVLSYFSFGAIGAIYLIIGLLIKQKPKSFLLYHVFMSVFLSGFIYVISMLLIGIINLLGYVPFINALVGTITFFFKKDVLVLAGCHFSLINLVIFAILLYLSVGAVMGKCTYLPWFTEIIEYNTKNNR